MADITISEATIGGARLAIVADRNKINAASTLLVTYVPEDQKPDYPTEYNKTLTLGGIPLSLTLCHTPANPSQVLGEGLYYAIDVIRNEAETDPIGTRFEIHNPSAEIDETIIMATDPADTTFTWNGNRLSASSINRLLYMNVTETGVNPSDVADFTPSNSCTLMGIPMKLDSNNELILSLAPHLIEDVHETVELEIGGTPLTAGRVNNKYYLIVKPVA